MQTPLWLSIIAVVISAFSIAGTLWSHFLNRRADIAPALVFMRSRLHHCWEIRNVGKGPALNIFIAGRKDISIESRINIVLVYPLKEGESILLEWMGSDGQAVKIDGAELIAIYDDIFKQGWTSKCYQHINTISQKKQYDWKPDDLSVIKEQDMKPAFQ